jgi:hypothetical protein
MKIHALTTGTVSVKHSFLFPRHGARRQLDLFLPGGFSEPLPIHCWAIEHARRADAIGPEPKVHVATLDTILAHSAEHPTVYLPSHDPESLARFTAATTVDVDGADRSDRVAELLAR